MIGRMFQRRGNQLVEVTNPSVILADTSNLVQGNAAPVYVNADTGDDVNDGMTANTAVRTIGKALELAANRGVSNFERASTTVFISEGDYNEDIVVRSRVLFDAQGVVNTGRIQVDSCGVAILSSSSNGSYVINEAVLALSGSVWANIAPCIIKGPILAVQNSVVYLENNVTIQYVRRTGTSSVMMTHMGGIIEVRSPLTIAADNPNSNVMVATLNGGINVTSSVSINATALSALLADCGGVLSIAGGSSINLSGTYSQGVAISGTGAQMLIDTGANMSGTPTGRRFYVSLGGIINVRGAGINRIPGSQPGNVDATNPGTYA